MGTGTINAVGIWFYCITTQKYLYLMRNDSKHFGSWGLAGGKVEVGETLLDTITRECVEEIGFMPEYTQLTPIDKFTSFDKRFHYHTFICKVIDEFLPKLNWEHVGYAWIDKNVLPKPLHPGLWNTTNLEEIKTKIDIVIDREESLAETKH